MRRLAVADLLLLLLLLLCVSEQNTNKESHRERLRQPLLLALRRLCSRFRRARVEPAASAGTSPAPDARGEEEQLAGTDDDVAAWRERCFGPASRALYTIHEESSTSSSASASTTSDGGDCESEGGVVDQEEPETPFYTPPASPPWPHSPRPAPAWT